MIKNDLVFINHILENIKDIESFSKNLTLSKLEKSKLKHNAIIRSLEIIGEATKNISPAFKKKYPKIRWGGMIGLRNKLIHHYFGVDFEIILEIIKEQLPILKKQLKEIIK